MTKEQPPLPPVNRSHLRLVFDRDRDIASIGSVESIGLSAGQLISERAQLAEFVEVPALPACEHLYDLNILTTSSCANGEKAAELGNAYIIVDWESLSPRNKEIAEMIGEHIVETIDKKGTVVERIKLQTPITPDDKTDVVTAGLLDLAKNFEPQPLEWGYLTPAQARKSYGYDHYKISDSLIIQALVDREGLVFDQDSQLLFYSEELLQKYRKTDELPE